MFVGNMSINLKVLITLLICCGHFKQLFFVILLEIKSVVYRLYNVSEKVILIMFLCIFDYLELLCARTFILNYILVLKIRLEIK